MRIIVPWQQKKRMRNTCFRRPRKANAGNFIPGLGWPDLVNMFQAKLEADILKGVCDNDKVISVTYESQEFIGWASTRSVIETDIITPNDDIVENFNLNKRATALRYKSGCGSDAPLTCEITFIISVPRHPEDPAIIQSMYPGHDVGELKGNVSIREQVIFYDFDHPGEALVEA